MAGDPLKEIMDRLRRMRPDQQLRVESFAKALTDPPEMVCSVAGFATRDFVHQLGDALQLHHLFSHEPFTKDKFEHATAAALNQTGHRASLAPRGNPGHDLTVGNERWSLKTQADAGIKRDTLHISKFMELGRGKWVTVGDLAGLRDQMLHHMRSYDRIFSLRCFRLPVGDGTMIYEYELVEIPKALLAKAQDGTFRLMDDSKQNPKPGYCTVTGCEGVLFELYFDGGTERKLQVRALAKRKCEVLATWRIKVQAPLER